MLKLTNKTKDVLVSISGATLNGDVIQVGASKSVEVDQKDLVQNHLEVFAIFGESLEVVQITEQPKKKAEEPKKEVKEEKKEEPAKVEEKQEAKKD